MNREILFRGKSLVSGYWIESDSIYRGYYNTTYLMNGTLERVIPETVDRYTGLVDRNGKKIFEGDIIKGKGKKAFAVEYSQNIAGFVTRGPGAFSCPCMNIGTMKSYEVIGNIHDNPEMLEVEND